MIAICLEQPQASFTNEPRLKIAKYDNCQEIQNWGASILGLHILVVAD